MDHDHKQLQRCLGNVTKLAKNALINYDAYIQGDAAMKNIDLAKYHAQIKAQLSDDSDVDDNESEAKIMTNPNVLVLYTIHKYR